MPDEQNTAPVQTEQDVPSTQETPEPAPVQPEVAAPAEETATAQETPAVTPEESAVISEPASEQDGGAPRDYKTQSTV